MDNTIRITNIQHFSVHDGPGVRTTVFTKGCNLKCQWCHNPETIQAKPQISYNEELCIGCGMCTQICPEHHRFDVQNGRHIYERKDCKVCEKCAEQCPTNALSVYGVSKTVEEIVEEAYRDSMVFPEFGGVTFSGGECLLQAKNIKKTAEILKQRGIHICIDTALNVAWDTIEGILPYTDLTCRYKSRNRRNTQKIYWCNEQNDKREFEKIITGSRYLDSHSNGTSCK